MYKDENRHIFWSKFFMRARTVLVYTVLVLLAILCLFTMYLLIINSTRSNDAIRRGFSPLPGGSIAHNFGLLFDNKNPDGAPSTYNVNLLQAMGNSLFVAIGATICSVYFSTVVAYGIHLYKFKLRNAAFTFILVVMMIPTQVSTAGFVRICYQFKWINHFFPLIIPSVASPVTFFYIKQYMESVLPYEMVEAARVDGAGEIRIFHQIVLPVMKPALAVQIIFAFVGSWNNYFLPQLILTKGNKATFPLVIAKMYSGSNKSLDYGMINACLFLAVIPLTVVYFFFSRFILKGLTLGAVKG